MGKLASAAVKEFAETGETEAFDKEARSQDGGGGGGGDEETNQLASSASSSSPLFDSFSAPPVESGAGTSRAKLFVDGNHTLVREIEKENIDNRGAGTKCFPTDFAHLAVVGAKQEGEGLEN